MKLRKRIKNFLGAYNFDREGERLIKKSIELYHLNTKLGRFRAQILHNKIRKKYGCCIYPEVTVGKDLYIAHCHEIIIGGTSVIGDNCRIYPGVYMAAALKGDDERYSAGIRRHPKIGNNCIIGAKSIIIGPITVGDNVTIGAGAIITKDVPDNTVVVGINDFRPKSAG